MILSSSFNFIVFRVSTARQEFKMRPSILLAAVAGLLTCSAAPTDNFVLHEKRDGDPHQWTKRNRAHPADILPVRIGLVQSNLHKAEEYILDVSDPYSPNFGKEPFRDIVLQSSLYQYANEFEKQENIGRRRKLPTLLHQRRRRRMEWRIGWLSLASMLRDIHILQVCTICMTLLIIGRIYFSEDQEFA